MSVIGADTSQLRALAELMGGRAGQIAAARSVIDFRLRTIPWQGANASRFRSQWVALRRNLQQTETGLQEASRLLRAQAAEQDRASAAGGLGTIARIPGISLDGAPRVATREETLDDFADRNTRVQSEIAADLEEMKRQRDLLLAELVPDGTLDEIREGIGDLLPGVNSKRETIGPHLAHLRTQIGYLEGLLEPSAATGQPRQYLIYDPTFRDQRLVEVVGDLSEADRVIIHIPGMNTDLGEYEEGGVKAATNLYLEANELSDENVVVISFMDYNVPDDLFEVASGAGADSGIAPLQDLVGDLHDMGFENDQLSVVAHSYGSVVAGHTMQDDLQVGRVITLGSPGMGANHRSGLGSPDVEVWSAKAPPTIDPRDVDWVTLAPAHGIGPSERGFGANSFEVPDAYGHSAYFEKDSYSLIAISTLAIGLDPVTEFKSRQGGLGGW